MQTSAPPASSGTPSSKHRSGSVRLATAALLLSVGASACTPRLCDELGELPRASIVAIGDSALAWNKRRCQTPIAHASLSLGQRITNRSVSGAQLLRGIPSQVPEDDWDLVIVEGGGNDLSEADACAGADPTPTLDRLATADGQAGAMAELVDDLLADDHRVLLVGYYGIREGGWYGLGDCKDEITALKVRYQAIADARAEVTWLDLERFVSADDKDAFVVDQIHPSPAGAERMGAAIAAAVPDALP